VTVTADARRTSAFTRFTYDGAAFRAPPRARYEQSADLRAAPLHVRGRRGLATSPSYWGGGDPENAIIATAYHRTVMLASWRRSPSTPVELSSAARCGCWRAISPRAAFDRDRGGSDVPWAIPTSPPCVWSRRSGRISSCAEPPAQVRASSEALRTYVTPNAIAPARRSTENKTRSGGEAMKIISNCIQVNYTLEGADGPIVTMSLSLATPLSMFDRRRCARPALARTASVRHARPRRHGRAAGAYT